VHHNSGSHCDYIEAHVPARHCQADLEAICNRYLHQGIIQNPFIATALAPPHDLLYTNRTSVLMSAMQPGARNSISSPLRLQPEKPSAKGGGKMKPGSTTSVCGVNKDYKPRTRCCAI
jgi:hypothetical protein